MNFKPTTWKLITSAVLGLLASLLLGRAYSCPEMGGYRCTFYFGYIIGDFIIGFVLTYLIWSLIQKRKV